VDVAPTAEAVVKLAWLIAAAAALLLLGGGAAVVVTLSERDRLRVALRAASARYNLPPEWLDAIAKVESSWRMGLVNGTGADGKRGGSWGPTQISQKTARASGYTGPMEAIRDDPEVAAEWSARILAASSPRDFADAVAAWNAGKYHADANQDGELDAGEAPSITVDDYWPKATAALAYVQENPPDDGTEAAA
jgi:soluble lytic murein transglycosylase-like protein